MGKGRVRGGAARLGAVREDLIFKAKRNLANMRAFNGMARRGIRPYEGGADEWGVASHFAGRYIDQLAEVETKMLDEGVDFNPQSRRLWESYHRTNDAHAGAEARYEQVRRVKGLPYNDW